jgi:D-methionine transport system ATP-binding protein
MNAPWTVSAETGLAAFPDAPSIVTLDRVRKVYGGRKDSSEVIALDEFSLQVPEGAIVGVIGKSGAGKSTIIRLISGLERPTSGRVVVDGAEISSLDERGLRGARRSIGLIFQHFNLLSSRTAFGNVALPLEIASRPKQEIGKRVDALLDLVGLADKRDRYPSELSGGQKQRVGIARALATGPKVLLSDEATSALDPETTGQILALLGRIRAELGLSIVLITHEMAVVRALADRLAVLDDGRIVEEGETFQLFAHPRHPTTLSFVSSVTGVALPEELRARLSPDCPADGAAVIRIVFSGPQAGEPVISRLTKLLDVDVNIVGGQVDSIGGRPFGALLITIPCGRGSIPAVMAALKRLNLASEILGYVA